MGYTDEEGFDNYAGFQNDEGDDFLDPTLRGDSDLAIDEASSLSGFDEDEFADSQIGRAHV